MDRPNDDVADGEPRRRINFAGVMFATVISRQRRREFHIPNHTGPARYT